jgi:hypothetical protein
LDSGDPELDKVTDHDMIRRTARINYEIVITHGLDGRVGFLWGDTFIHAVDVEYSSTLDRGISFSSQEVAEALRLIRRTYFRQRALFRGMNGNDFGSRLRGLLDDRNGDYLSFASPI